MLTGGRSFEVSSQPQVGGVLGRHWSVWLSYGAKEWTVEVLQRGCCVPFQHLPPASQEPVEFLSYATGSVRAHDLQKEVSKMLQKGALERVNQPSLGFYSHLFLVQKVTGLETCHQSVNPEWVCHPYQVPDGDSGIGLGVGQEGRHDVPCRPQGLLLSDPHSS